MNPLVGRGTQLVIKVKAINNRKPSKVFDTPEN